MFRGLIGRGGRHRRALRVGDSLRKYQKMQIVGEMTTSLAHDMNNLLQIISGCCEVLLENDLPPHIRTNVEQMGKGAAQACGFLDKLLAFMRGESPIPELIEIDVALKEMEVLLRFSCGTSVELELDLDASTSKIAINRTHFEQLVLNLVINSREASAEGGKVCIRTKAVPLSGSGLSGSKLRKGNYVSLEVSDRGCGIDAEAGVHMFEPFFTAKAPGDRGLGLSIVRQILNVLGGELQVTSAKDRGTTVRALLPEASQDFEHVKGGRSKNGSSSKRSWLDDNGDIPLLWSCALATYSTAGGGAF